MIFRIVPASSRLLMQVMFQPWRAGSATALPVRIPDIENERARKFPEPAGTAEHGTPLNAATHGTAHEGTNPVEP
jgi:hypothetical protein